MAGKKHWLLAGALLLLAAGGAAAQPAGRSLLRLFFITDLHGSAWALERIVADAGDRNFKRHFGFSRKVQLAGRRCQRLRRGSRNRWRVGGRVAGDSALGPESLTTPDGGGLGGRAGPGSTAVKPNAGPVGAAAPQAPALPSKSKSGTGSGSLGS
jgi:hypothetical protein